MCKHTNFIKELRVLHAEAKSRLGPEDLKQFKNLAFIGRALSFLGYATCWVFPNPVSALLISQGNFTRWIIIAHHAMHGAYDGLSATPKRFKSKYFGHGWRRYTDWFDWLIPEYWLKEHNMLHHNRLGELADSDLVVENSLWIRKPERSLFVRKVWLFLLMISWKYTYYAPNTLVESKMQSSFAAKDSKNLFALKFWSPFTNSGRQVWLQCWLPYFLVHFVAIPLGFALISHWAAMSAFLSILLAEVFTNVYSFVLIAPSHTAEDVHRYSGKPADRDERYLRQILGVANYNTGRGSMHNFLHGWVNYHIEHHLFPRLSLKQYEKISPKLKALCKNYGYPYHEESVFVRFKKCTDIILGKKTMPMIKNAKDFKIHPRKNS